ncbi:SRPBCC family protein [Lacisediminimonas sp.]|uniref:SRPBCC family protein n=1 Tax=Lacisediminimonas sp. TaxID=3060582 RepID=UPI00271D728D|nr:SRPBCC family protein [Lacisediminimonas sp.]MDO8298586.1 SRPBCC family protein [Lacisediminimonas sp.]MDO9217768.1 SRPBCC family protein [Lacisediminimonas sp.]
MRFSHLVEINDPQNPLITPLTRDQLWRGLVLRAEMPKRFVPWLDQCIITARTQTSIERALHYGETVIRDSVTFEAPDRIGFHVPRQGDIPDARLTMTIEQPFEGGLFVRFEYADGGDDAVDTAESTDQQMVNDFRRSAYQESDIDTIRTIREMAADGLLDAPMM